MSRESIIGFSGRQKPQPQKADVDNMKREKKNNSVGVQTLVVHFKGARVRRMQPSRTENEAKDTP